MSRQVRMKVGDLGWRAGGVRWPNYNEVLDTDDKEAAYLVGQGYAVYLEDEPVVRLVSGFDTLRPISENYEPPVTRESQEPEDGPEVPDSEDDLVDEGDGPKRPYANASKDAWVEYAVSRGEDPDVASRMTKADLISKHGASL